MLHYTAFSTTHAFWNFFTVSDIFNFSFILFLLFFSLLFSFFFCVFIYYGARIYLQRSDL